jgi:hypothetical protein
MTKHAPIFPPALRLALPVLCCAAFAASLSTTASAQTWSPVTYIGPYSEEYPSAPAFDPAGNAWVGLSYFNSSNSQTTFQVVQSNGTSGTWQQPVTLLQSGGISPEIFGVPSVTVDHSGAVSVVYAIYLAGVYQLQSFRYVPGGGWQGPVVAYSSPSGLAVVGSAVDSNNNLVVIFYEGTNGPPYSTWSIIYSSATQTWGTPQRLSPQKASTSLWSLASDPSGANIMLVYVSAIGPAHDFYSWKYVPSSQSWVGAAVPDTGKPQFPFSDNYGRFPLAMDSSGNATLLADYYDTQSDESTVYGFRYENGQWGKGVELLPLQAASGFVEFGDGGIAVDSSGIAVGALLSSREGGIVYAFRYTPGYGWDTETAAVNPYPQGVGGVGVTFLGSTPGEAVIVYPTTTNFTSSVYLNGVWSATAPITAVGAFSAALAQAPSGQDLFVSASENPPAAAWLTQ